MINNYNVEEAYIYSLLKKFVTEDLSDAELLVFKEIVGNEEYAPIIDRLMDSEWETLKPGIDFSKLQAEILYQKIISDQRYVDRAKQKPRQLRTLTAKLLWAACFCMVVTSVILMIYNYHKPASTVYLFYKAPLGQRISRFLPDGSKVWINAGSTLRITKNFDSKAREVFLQGEAFFDVVHKDKIPFVIHTGSITTQVLGTAFNIRAYPQKDINIIVLRGLVGVKGRRGLLGLIKPDQQLTYDQKTEISSSGEINARLFTSWMRNELQLNNVNMAEAAETLARWYNVKIVFDHASLKNGSFTASFSAGTPLRQVMAIISKINKFNYKLSADTVYISRSAAVQ